MKGELVHRLVIATSATETPMGAQHYQEAIAARAESALSRTAGDPWRVDRVIARSVRSPLPGTARLPMGRLRRAGVRERALFGRFLYPRDTVVHRMDLTLPPPSGPEVVTLHDVVAWRFPDEEKPASAAADEIRRADAVICVSEFTAGEAADLLGLQQTVVVPNGVDDHFFEAQPLPAESLERLGVRGRFALYAGGSAARKNLAGLAGAWSLLRERVPDTQLVLAGPRSTARDELFAGLDDVVHVGRVDDATLTGLMASASTVVVPSTYEGFGLPALEALAVGTPLVCARTSSLPEVVGDAALLVEPTPDHLAQGLEAVLLGQTDNDTMVSRGRERAARFTWDVSAERHARVWEQVL